VSLDYVYSKAQRAREPGVYIAARCSVHVSMEYT